MNSQSRIRYLSPGSTFIMSISHSLADITIGSYRFQKLVNDQDLLLNMLMLMIYICVQGPLPECPPQLGITASVMQEFIQEQANKTPQIYQPLPIPSKESEEDAEWQFQLTNVLCGPDNEMATPDPDQTS